MGLKADIARLDRCLPDPRKAERAARRVAVQRFKDRRNLALRFIGAIEDAGVADRFVTAINPALPFLLADHWLTGILHPSADWMRKVLDLDHQAAYVTPVPRALLAVLIDPPAPYWGFYNDPLPGPAPLPPYFDLAFACCCRCKSAVPAIGYPNRSSGDRRVPCVPACPWCGEDHGLGQHGS